MAVGSVVLLFQPLAADTHDELSTFLASTLARGASPSETRLLVERRWRDAAQTSRRIRHQLGLVTGIIGGTLLTGAILVPVLAQPPSDGGTTVWATSIALMFTGSLFAAVSASELLVPAPVETTWSAYATGAPPARAPSIFARSASPWSRLPAAARPPRSAACGERGAARRREPGSSHAGATA